MDNKHPVYSRQTQYAKPYLSTPNYSGYVDTIQRGMKSGPFYGYNEGPRMCIMYNYVQPVPPYISPPCSPSPRFQYWYTPQ